MPCHNQQVTSTSTPSPEEPQPGDLIPDPAGENGAFKAKPAVLTSHAHSSVPGEGGSEACADASLNSESDGGSGDCEAPARDGLVSDSQLSCQIGPQLKLLPMNDQIRELQTIIRDK